MEESVTTLDPYRIESPRRALVLGATAGYVDIVGFVMLFGLFAAYMSGNTALAGRDLGLGEVGTALARLIPVLAFVVFALLAFTLTHFRLRRGRATLRPLLAIESALLVVVMLIGTHWYDRGSLRPESLEYYALALIAVGAMAFQAVAVRKVAGTGVRTTFITAMLVAFAEDTVAWWTQRDDAARHRARIHGGIAVCYLVGASAGAFVADRWELWSLVVPVVALLILLVESPSSVVGPDAGVRDAGGADPGVSGRR